MCFNLGVSVLFFVTELAACIYMWWRNKYMDRAVVPILFTVCLIELTEIFMWADSNSLEDMELDPPVCGKMNSGATIFNRIVITTQPFALQWWGYFGSYSRKKEFFKSLLILYAGIWISSVIIYTPINRSNIGVSPEAKDFMISEQSDVTHQFAYTTCAYVGPHKILLWKWRDNPLQDQWRLNSLLYLASWVMPCLFGRPMRRFAYLWFILTIFGIQWAALGTAESLSLWCFNGWTGHMFYLFYPRIFKKYEENDEEMNGDREREDGERDNNGKAGEHDENVEMTEA